MPAALRRTAESACSSCCSTALVTWPRNSSNVVSPMRVSPGGSWPVSAAREISSSNVAPFATGLPSVVLAGSVGCGVLACWGSACRADVAAVCAGALATGALGGLNSPVTGSMPKKACSGLRGRGVSGADRFPPAGGGAGAAQTKGLRLPPKGTLQPCKARSDRSLSGTRGRTRPRSAVTLKVRDEFLTRPIKTILRSRPSIGQGQRPRL